MPLAAETRSACGSLHMPGRVMYDPRPVGAPVALGWPACPYRQHLATPWPVARQRSHDGAPCVGHSPPVEPRPLPSPRREALGLDRWSLADLRSLPDRLLGWQAEVERLGSWPARLAQGYTALIPKEGPPGPLNTRPLTVPSMV